MKKLTVIILAKDEEEVIGDAIKSAKDFASEILVIDANSQDKTSQIAEKQGAKVIKHSFKDFSDQRNFAVLYATTPWVMYLDSDERLTNEFKNEAEQIISGHKEFDPIGGYFVKRRTFYYGHDWGFDDRVQRLFIRERLEGWFGKVHETPKIKGEFGVINSPLVHLTHRNLSQMIKKTNEWSEFEAQLRLDAGHPILVPWRFIRVMTTSFIDSYFKNRGYKNGVYGLIEAIYQSFSIFITYAKLWEMQEKR
jgi:glycosyltransferase involved in cell wall biosynthesis